MAIHVFYITEISSNLFDMQKYRNCSFLPEKVAIHFCYFIKLAFLASRHPDRRGRQLSARFSSGINASFLFVICIKSRYHGTYSISFPVRYWRWIQLNTTEFQLINGNVSDRRHPRYYSVRNAVDMTGNVSHSQNGLRRIKNLILDIKFTIGFSNIHHGTFNICDAEKNLIKFK